MDSYLLEFYEVDISNLVNDKQDFSHISINISLRHLQTHRPNLYSNVIKNVWEASKEWDKALLEAQKKLVESSEFLEPGFQIKENCYVRFTNIPENPSSLNGVFPNNAHIGLFVQVNGTVVRITQSRMLEFKKEYICSRCKEVFVIEAEYERMYVFEIPKKCMKALGACKGNLKPMSAEPKAEYCKDYQEIKIQELISEKNIPSSLNVTLENDLVDICQPGENVTICGTIERRWGPLIPGKRMSIRLSMRAISVTKDDKQSTDVKDISEQNLLAFSEWESILNRNGELNARDILIKSICPEIHGMYLVKLAIALALCSGIEKVIGGVKIRGHSHLLLLGDPGLAKSKLLKSASKIASRAVYTTGMGCSAAGLTAAAMKEGGEWQLEAGALVLADGGVCCIDEFNLMRESDKASIHEAMEQQTISMAKAGLVCKLSTRCVVLAAANPKSLRKMQHDEDIDYMNIGIGTPLLSRFDLIYILRDEHDAEWDSKVADSILNTAMGKICTSDIWTLNRLKSHFSAIRHIDPTLTPIANEILREYYKYSRSDGCRDPSRTTVRLLDSLHRLAQSHAKLLYRRHVNGIDAITVILLMEASIGFGRLTKPENLIMADLPLGPSEKYIQYVLTALNLKHLEEEIIDEFRKLNARTSPKKHDSKEMLVEASQNNSEGNLNHDSFGLNESNSHQSNTEKISGNNKRNRENDSSILNVGDLESIFGYNKGVKKLKKSNEQIISEPSNANTTQITSKWEILQEKLTSTSDERENLAINEKTNSIINTYPNLTNLDDIDMDLEFFKKFDTRFDEDNLQETSIEKVKQLTLNEKSTVKEKMLNFSNKKYVEKSPAQIHKEKPPSNQSYFQSLRLNSSLLYLNDEDLEFDVNADIDTLKKVPEVDLIRKKTKICKEVFEPQPSTSKDAFERDRNPINKLENRLSSPPAIKQYDVVPNKVDNKISSPQTPKVMPSPTSNTPKSVQSEKNSSDRDQIKNKVSPATIKKLNMFKNPNHIEKTSTTNRKDFTIENEFVVLQQPVNVTEEKNSTSKHDDKQKNDEDSAYDTMSSSSSYYQNHLIGLKDDDLSFLDFDI